MSKHTPTKEQSDIIEAAQRRDSHLHVEARAGAAKTSTLVMVAEAIPGETILCLAFNKSIKEEMQARMPSNVTAMTLNGIGYKAWRDFLGRSLKIDAKKDFFLLRKEIEKLEKLDADEAWERFGETLKGISAAKTSGVLVEPYANAYRPLMSIEDFFNGAEIDYSDLQRALIKRVLRESWTLATTSVIDFDDQLLGPAVAGVSFERYDRVLVDEAQDLNGIQHHLLKKIARGKTLVIAVGDPAQAIYGFRGAFGDSMDKLKAVFPGPTLYLTTTFRCAKRIVEAARWRTPDINAAPWAPAGEVIEVGTWDHRLIPDGAAIICRNNAPIFALAVRLLREGRYPELKGRDIVKNLVAIMKKLGKAHISREAAMANAEAWASRERERQRTEGLVDDQLACMRIFIEDTNTLGEASTFAEKLSEATGRIQLMTGHRAKGLEFDEVFFLNRELCRRDRGQDANIEYVIITRAKQKLYYVSSESMGEAE